MPAPEIDGGGITFSGYPSGRLLSVCPLSVIHPLTLISCCNISVLSGEISMKLAINIYHMSGHCWSFFQGQSQRSRSSFLIIICELLFVPLQCAISSVQLCECNNSGGTHFHGVALRLAYFCYNELSCSHKMSQQRIWSTIELIHVEQTDRPQRDWSTCVDTDLQSMWLHHGVSMCHTAHPSHTVPTHVLAASSTGHNKLNSVLTKNVTNE